MGKHPNFLLIITDQQRYETIAALGYPHVETPVLDRLVREGYRMRVYVPFGKEWFPYFMRRLGERPANVGFVVRSILREK